MASRLSTPGAKAFKGKPEANVPLNIGGSYSGDVTVGGSLISGEWKAPVDIKFNFGGADEGNGGPVHELFIRLNL